ncbi:MAG: hypothetical protein JNL94_15395 [Planctomycetes bacterium]|nr:hypothetical protein [Planctomycetota bacterium]
MQTLLFAAALFASDPFHPDDILTGVVKTDHFVIRFREGSRAEASVDRVMVAAEADLARILARLEFPQFSETITLYLYDDVVELRKITQTQSDGVSVTRTSHVPHDNDQTRLHELVHVVAEFLPEKGDEPRSLFFAEGIANAVLEHVHGIHVHSVAAFEMRRGMLPSLDELHRDPDFYGWLARHPGVNGYDIGGSYVLHLFETYGVKKTRRYYKGASAKEAFGKSLADVEKGWHARLAKVQLRPGLEQLLRERSGQPAQFTKYVEPDGLLTPQLLGPPAEWTALKPKQATGNGVGSFARDGDAWVLEGPRDSGDWAECVLSDATYGDAWVKCRAEPVGDCFGVKLILGPKCQALLIGGGSFIYTDIGGIAHDADVKCAGKPVDIVLRRVGGKATVWFDGVKVLEANVPGDAAPVSIGVVQGSAKFTDVAVRVPKS